MSDVLIRGIPPRMHSRIQKLAQSENLSVNQAFLKLVASALEQLEKQEDEEERRREAFRGLKELRARLHAKYGKFDDSTKLIREDRDSR